MNFGGDKNIGSSSTAKPVTSKGRIEVRRIGDPLFLRTKIGTSSSNELCGSENEERVQ